MKKLKNLIKYWKKLLDKKIKENLEKELENEMKELNYL